MTRGERGFVTDASDASVTRSAAHWRRLFAAARLHVVHEERVKGFPAALFPVAMWALKRDDEQGEEKK